MDALKPTVLGLCIVGGDAQRLSCVQGSDDATRCIAGFADSTVRIWRPDAVEDDDKNRRPSLAAAHVGGVASVSWAGGSRYAILGQRRRRVVLWGLDAPSDEGEGAPLQRYARTPTRAGPSIRRHLRMRGRRAHFCYRRRRRDLSTVFSDRRGRRGSSRGTGLM